MPADFTMCLCCCLAFPPAVVVGIGVAVDVSEASLWCVVADDDVIQYCGGIGIIVNRAVTLIDVAGDIIAGVGVGIVLLLLPLLMLLILFVLLYRYDKWN